MYGADFVRRAVSVTTRMDDFLYSVETACLMPHKEVSWRPCRVGRDKSQQGLPYYFLSYTLPSFLAHKYATHSSMHTNVYEDTFKEMFSAINHIQISG